MSLLHPVRFFKHELQKINDNGVSIESIIQLFDFIETDYVEFLKRHFHSEISTNGFIQISGAKTLINTVINRESKYTKYDLECKLGNIECLEIGSTNSLKMRFNNIQNSNLKDELEEESIIAKTIHSSKAEFLEGNFRIKKFSDYLYSKGLNQIAIDNISKLSSLNSSEEKKYRLIKDHDNEFYLRGITSVSGYRNYNIPFSVCLSLLALHRAYKNSIDTININSIYLDDSNIEVVFSRGSTKTLGNIGMVNHHVVLSNDEIRRKSMSLSGMSSILYKVNSTQKEVYFQPKKEIKAGIISISHGSKPETWVGGLDLLSESIRNNEAGLFTDYEKLKTVKDADQLRFALQNAFKRASTESIKKYKGSIDSILSQKIDSIHLLLELLNKVSLLAQEDLEAREYMRYIFYTKVLEKKG